MLRNLIITLGFLYLSLASGFSWGAMSPEQEALARRLLNSQGCKACHRFEGQGAAKGPSLEELSSRLNQTELYQALVNPGGMHGNDLIPDFSHLDPDQLQALVSFLQDLLPEEQETTSDLGTDQPEQAPPADKAKP